MKNRWWPPVLIIGVLFAVIIVGCIGDAPRDNPLDPANGIDISGKVLRLVDNQPIKGALVSVQPIHRIAETDVNGEFHIPEVPRGTYILHCQAEGFAPDSVSLTVNQSTTWDFHLNGLPRLVDVSLTTWHISRVFPIDDDFFVQVNVQADDPDNRNQVQNVWYEIPALGFADTLTEISLEKEFLGILRAPQAGVDSLDALIGKPFVLYVEDIFGDRTRRDNLFLTRIIKKTPTTVFPLGHTVSVPFTMQWNPVRLPYPFTYTVEVFVDDFIVTRIAEISAIPSDSTRIPFTMNLDPTRQYFWVLYVVDEFGNRSRSKQSPFRVSGSGK